MPGSQDGATEVVRLFAALSDENRFRIVELLAERTDALSCRDICAELGLSPSLLSHHLSILENAGIIQRRKDRLCTLNGLRRDVMARHFTELQHLVAEPAGRRAEA